MLYDGCFDMVRRCSGGGPDRGVRGKRLRPLFVSESLSATNKEIFNSLMDLRRSGGGVASVFTRRGIVYFRRERGGENIRVPDLGQLQQLTWQWSAGPERSGPDPGGPAAAGTGPPAGSPTPAAAPGAASSAAGVSAAPGGAASAPGARCRALRLLLRHRPTAWCRLSGLWRTRGRLTDRRRSGGRPAGRRRRTPGRLAGWWRR